MLITNNFESHARKLLSPELSLAQKQQLVTEMRDSIEIVHTSEYGNFLRHLFPAFYRLLSEGQPQFTEVRAGAEAPGRPVASSLPDPPLGAAAIASTPSAWLGSRCAAAALLRLGLAQDGTRQGVLPCCMRRHNAPPHSQPCPLPPTNVQGPEQKIRNMLLEVLNRLPNNETLRPHVQSMLSLCMKLLDTDNEENAVICLRIIFDLHKNFRPTLEREVRTGDNWRSRAGCGAREARPAPEPDPGAHVSHPVAAPAQVQPFLDFVERIYRGLPKTVALLFSEPRGGDGAGGDKGPGGLPTTREALTARAEQAQVRSQAAQAQAQRLAQAVVAANAQAQARAQAAQQLHTMSQAQPTPQVQAQAAQAAQAAQQAAQQAQTLSVQSQQAAAAAKQAQQLAACAVAAATASPKAGEGAPSSGALADAAATPASAPGAAPAGASSGGGGRGGSTGVLTRSTESFKVLTECPLIVMLLFQLYPRYIQSTIPALIPLMVQTLALQTPRRAIQRHRQATTDFMAAQVRQRLFFRFSAPHGWGLCLSVCVAAPVGRLERRGRSARTPHGWAVGRVAWWWLVALALGDPCPFPASHR